jgi:CheY-like chemotaxis protein
MKVLLDIKVLVVDDDEDTRDLLDEVLTARGARVVSASTVEQAFSMLQETRPDVIVSDLGMPGEGGLALLRRVRGLPPESGGATPAIAVTGSTSSKDRTGSLEAGFQGHLPKPVDVQMLVRLIGELARR